MEEIKNSSKEMLTPADICKILGVAQYTINVQPFLRTGDITLHSVCCSVQLLSRV